MSDNNQTFLDPRLTADLDEVERLEANMGWDDHKRWISIAQLWTSSEGRTYLVGNIGEFADRHEALRFMDDNPELFADPTNAHALVMVTRENSSKIVAL